MRLYTIVELRSDRRLSSLRAHSPVPEIGSDASASIIMVPAHHPEFGSESQARSSLVPRPSNYFLQETGNEARRTAVYCTNPSPLSSASTESDVLEKW